MFGLVLGLECLHKLPFSLELGYSEERCTHDTDNEGRQVGINSLQLILRASPCNFADIIKGSKDPAANEKVYQGSTYSAVPYLYKCQLYRVAYEMVTSNVHGSGAEHSCRRSF